MVLPVAAMLLPLLLSRVAEHRCCQHHSVAADSNDCFLHATATIFLLLAWLLRLAPVGYCGWPQLAIAAGPSWILRLAPVGYCGWPVDYCLPSALFFASLSAPLTRSFSLSSLSYCLVFNAIIAAVVTVCCFGFHCHCHCRPL